MVLLWIFTALLRCPIAVRGPRTARRLSALINKKNDYLAAHSRAGVEVAWRDVRAYAKKLRIAGWVEIEADGRAITTAEDEAALAQAARLDGCYALKTDVSRGLADAATVRVWRSFSTPSTSNHQPHSPEAKLMQPPNATFPPAAKPPEVVRITGDNRCGQ